MMPFCKDQQKLHGLHLECTFTAVCPVRYQALLLNIMLFWGKAVATGASYGLRVPYDAQTPLLEGLPDLGEPDKAWPLHQQSAEEERCTVRLTDIYLKVSSPHRQPTICTADSNNHAAIMIPNISLDPVADDGLPLAAISFP